jgi:hypothetical protein
MAGGQREESFGPCGLRKRVRFFFGGERFQEQFRTCKHQDAPQIVNLTQDSTEKGFVKSRAGHVIDTKHQLVPVGPLRAHGDARSLPQCLGLSEVH